MPSVYTSPLSTVIRANGTDFNSFAGDYEPSGMIGASIISYTFFNVQNEEDSVMVTAFYQVGATGINNVSFNADQIKIYPNPVIDRLNIEFATTPEDPYDIKIFNLNGQQIRVLASNSSAKTHVINLDDIPSSTAIIEIRNSKGLVIHKKVLIRN